LRLRASGTRLEKRWRDAATELSTSRTRLHRRFPSEPPVSAADTCSGTDEQDDGRRASHDPSPHGRSRCALVTCPSPCCKPDQRGRHGPARADVAAADAPKLEGGEVENPAERSGYPRRCDEHRRGAEKSLGRTTPAMWLLQVRARHNPDRAARRRPRSGRRSPCHWISNARALPVKGCQNSASALSRGSVGTGRLLRRRPRRLRRRPWRASRAGARLRCAASEREAAPNGAAARRRL
jgi:hypothetical protein